MNGSQRAGRARGLRHFQPCNPPATRRLSSLGDPRQQRNRPEKLANQHQVGTAIALYQLLQPAALAGIGKGSRAIKPSTAADCCNRADEFAFRSSPPSARESHRCHQASSTRKNAMCFPACIPCRRCIFAGRVCFTAHWRSLSDCPRMHRATATPPTATALLIVDMMNMLDFPEGALLARRAAPVARRIARLKQRFVERGAPVVYANDNFGAWHMDFRTLVEVCAQGTGREWVDALRPDGTDYYILKPKHSAFFATPMRVLLGQLHVGRLVLCGVATDVCIAATAIDAHMHGFEVIVPADCVQAETAARNAAALRWLETSFQVNTGPAARVRLA
jgi:nicotinamidase-related amidase